LSHSGLVVGILNAVDAGMMSSCVPVYFVIPVFLHEVKETFLL